MQSCIQRQAREATSLVLNWTLRIDSVKMGFVADRTVA
jgi:hypothetical protein